MAAVEDRIEEPPAALSPPLPDLRLERPAELWRLHWEPDPGNPEPKAPRWRFDAPAGEYLVSYANVERHHIFVEVYGDTTSRREIAPNQKERRISVGIPNRELHLVDLGDAVTLSRLHLDGRVNTTLDYPRTQLWSRVLHDWFPLADGIRYPGRKAGREDNVCLFLDRCRDAVEWEEVGTIETERTLVTRACEMFDIVPRVYLTPSGDPDWP